MKKNNKNSPYNMNEIDINLLMSNPKHIHKLMGNHGGENKLRAESEPECESDSDDEESHLDFFKKHGLSSLKKIKKKVKKRVNNARDKAKAMDDKIYKFMNDPDGAFLKFDRKLRVPSELLTTFNPEMRKRVDKTTERYRLHDLEKKNKK